jgi:hypothetical protein
LNQRIRRELRRRNRSWRVVALGQSGDRFCYSVTASPNKLYDRDERALAARIDTLQANTTWATNTKTHPERIVPVKSTTFTSFKST